MIIDVYADIVCPWCYIGEQRLEQALAQRPDLLVTRRWRPYQLQPQMPQGGLPWREFARAKFGGDAGAQAAFAQVTRVGAADGITFAFDRVVSAPNTVDGHRLIRFAAQHDREWEVATALFGAYFAEGCDLNNHDQLATVAEQNGLDPTAVRQYLASTEGVADVLISQQHAVDLGVQSVPHYIIDGRYRLVGAQPVDVFVQALEYASANAARQPRESIPLRGS